MLLLGAGGPLDAARRRPWIDWLHTATDQAALVRPYLKWDDQPGSVEAATKAVAHAHRLASTTPRAPVYVCLDTALQEDDLTNDWPLTDQAPRTSSPSRPPA